MSRNSTLQNPPSEVDELRQMIEAWRRNEEARRRDQWIDQQVKMLRQLLTCLNDQQQQPHPQQSQQLDEAAAPAEVNVLVPPMLRPNVQLLRIVPLIGELIYEHFRKYKLSMFQGTPDPTKAENWIKRIQQIFEYMQLADTQKLACIVCQFDDEARCWWEMIVKM